jgi:hypothetical protein
VESGLIKKATIVGMEGKGHEVEGVMVKALCSRGVQLVELKLLNLAFSGATQDPDCRSAKELALVLQALQVNSRGVNGVAPPEVGEPRRLAFLNPMIKKLEGEL